MPGTGYEMHYTGCEIHDTRCGLLNTGCGTHDTCIGTHNIEGRHILFSREINRKKKKDTVKGKPKKKSKSKNAINQCEDCIPAKCCMYFSVEIDEPEDMDDWNDMLWIMAHRDVQIYMDDDRWFVMVNNPCRFYDPIKGCMIYPVRPNICRTHTWEGCEFERDYDFELHFHSYEELERYIRTSLEEVD